MIADIVPDCQQNLHEGSVVLHGELNGASCDRERGTAPHRVLAAAWEGAEFVFVETTGFGGVESEMGGDEREKEKQECRT